jgi:hypothetical protein
MTLAMDSPADGWAASTSALTGTGDHVLILHYRLSQWRPVDIPALDAVLKGPPWSAGGSVIASISVQMFGPDAGWMFAWTNIPRDHNNPASRSMVVILRYDQGVWTPIAAPAVAPTTQLFTLSAVSADEAWIVGTDYGGPLTALFAHYVNGSWSLWPQTFPGVIERLAMFSPADGWALATNTGRQTLLLHYAGTTWAPVPQPSAWATQGVGLSSRIFPTTASATWFGAYILPGTLLVEEYANGDWQQVTWPFSDAFPAALAAPSSTELWGVGDIEHQLGCGSAHVWEVEQGVLLHFEQGRWTEQILP